MRHAPSYRELARDERGTTLVELAIGVSLFLLIFLGSIDFARFYYHFTATEKALAVAVRTATVRPPVCANVPSTNERGAPRPDAVTPDFGASCGGGLSDADGNPVGGTICAEVVRSCTLPATVEDDRSTTAWEIWQRLGAALPPNATPENIRITYAFDPAINFLGGPFVPNVSVEVTGVDFEFITPVGALASMAGAATATFDQSPPFPSLRAFAPGEDLANGNGG